MTRAETLTAQFFSRTISKIEVRIIFLKLEKIFPHQIRTYVIYHVLVTMELHTAKSQSISDTYL